MKVTTYVINKGTPAQYFGLKNAEENTVLYYAPNNWKTEKGALNWAKKTRLRNRIRPKQQRRAIRPLHNMKGGYIMKTNTKTARVEIKKLVDTIGIDNILNEHINDIMHYVSPVQRFNGSVLYIIFLYIIYT